MAVGGLFVEVGMMLVEGRMPGATPSPPRPGPHCPQLTPATAQSNHACIESNHLCARAEALRRHMSLLSENRVPMCIDVYLCTDCSCGKQRAATSQPATTDLLLEQWTITFNKSTGSQQAGGCMMVDGRGLLAAIRSQLHFSQLSAWYSRHGGDTMPPVCYRLSHPAPPAPSFHRPPVEHVFPLAKIHNNNFLKVSMKSLPRLDSVPEVMCPIHGRYHAAPVAPKRSATPPSPAVISQPQSLIGPKRSPLPSRPFQPSSTGSPVPVSSRAPTAVPVAGPAPAPSASQAAQATITAFRTVFAELGHCLLDPPSRIPPLKQGFLAWRERRSQVVSSQNLSHGSNQPSVPPSSRPRSTSSIVGMVDDRMQCGCKHIGKHHCEEPLDTDHESNQLNTTINPGCDKERRKSTSSPTLLRNDLNVRPPPVPASSSVHHCNNCMERELNRANVRYAAGRPCEPGAGNAWHGTTPQIILPMPLPTSQPPNPLKRKRQQEGTNNKKLLSDRQTDTLTSQQLVDIFRRLDIRSNDRLSIDKEVERVSEAVSPPSPHIISPLATSPLPSSPSPNKKSIWTDSSSETESESPSRPGLPSSLSPCLSIRLLPVSNVKRRSVPLQRGGPLLGSLEESLLKRRLPPARIVSTGYTVDLGASGSFCPKHLTLPVSVEFYPPTGLSTPLLGSTAIGKKGYSVPRAGTIQATLLNPHGTVVKMFVVPYDLGDMPPNSTTFIRQRILSSCSGTIRPLLRYLIHLRFSSSKSGRLYLEGEISMVVCRQFDADATLGLESLDTNSHLHSELITPGNPKFSPRK